MLSPGVTVLSKKTSEDLAPIFPLTFVFVEATGASYR